jgi:uncharacterized membrane protein
MQNNKDMLLKIINKSEDKLTAAEQHVLKHIREKRPISRNKHQEYTDTLTFGQRIADKVASFGGSWPFIGLFVLFLVIWVGGNTLYLVLTKNKPFDPFPFILLNLFLSMLAAIQAPVIMMSQNRQAAHDRLDAQHDYEVNLKSELEIMSLHHKLDELRETQLLELIELQKRQISMLENILQEKDKQAE